MMPHETTNVLSASGLTPVLMIVLEDGKDLNSPHTFAQTCNLRKDMASNIVMV